MNTDVMDWLLETQDAGVRYVALRDLLNLSPDDPQLTSAAVEAHRSGPIRSVLDVMQPEGYWEKPGAGYGPKYRSTVWAVTMLAQMGADVAYDSRINTACQYLLDQSLVADGRFSYNQRPHGTFDCLQGNLTGSLLMLGCKDSRLDLAVDWAARSQTGEGIAPSNEKKAAAHYTVYKCGPNFACGANAKLPCAWGAVKIMLALASVKPEKRTPAVNQAIEAGIDFLLGVDPSTAGYPTSAGQPPNRSWWSFGFPVFYVTDVLQLAEELARLGLKADTRINNLIDLILSKRDQDGRWVLEYNYGSKTWGNFGKMKQPNKWVTLRALRALQALAPERI